MRASLLLQTDTIKTQMRADMEATLERHGYPGSIVDDLLADAMPHVMALLIENDVLQSERDNALFDLGRHV